MPNAYRPTYKMTLMGIGCLATLLVLIIAIVYYLSSPLTTTLKQQLAALRAGNIEKAYSYTSMDFRNATSLKDFTDFIDHYPAFKHNKSIRFTKEDIRSDAAVIRGILSSTDGIAMPAEYLLTKEDDEWRIMGIQTNPTDDADIQETNEKSDASAALTKSYDNKNNRYLIQYPANWEYEKTNDGTIIFSGKRGTAAYVSTLNIQTVLTKKMGGQFSSVKQFMTDLKNQAIALSPGVQFYDTGPIQITEKNGESLEGRYTVFSYRYKNKTFKQWQIVVPRHDNQVFYAFAYTSPITQYPHDLATAKNMLASWIIY